MISYEEFLEIFKGSGFKKAELRTFYFSVKKAVVLRAMGKRALPELFRLEEKCQWPILRRIDDPELSIYRDADKRLLDNFIGTISKEKDLRQRKTSVKKVPYWSRLQAIIDERTELLIHIFGFGKEDVEHCESLAARYTKMKEKRDENRKKMLHIGIGAGAATLAGAAIWYISKKEKK